MKVLRFVFTLALSAVIFAIVSRIPRGLATWPLYFVPIAYAGYKFSRRQSFFILVLNLGFITVNILYFIPSPDFYAHAANRIVGAGAALACYFLILSIRKLDQQLKELHENRERLRRSEDDLRQSEDFLRSIIEVEPECIKIIDFDNKLLMMNPAGLAMIEADSFEQVKGKPITEMVAPEDREAFKELTRAVMRGETGKLEFKAEGLKGRQLWLETHAVPFFNRQHEINGVLSITRDITGRKSSERSIAFLSFALDTVREAAFLVDEKARFLYANEASCRIMGYTREQLLGLRVADIDPDFPLERWTDHWADLKQQRALIFESRHKTKDGHIFPVEISANYFEYGGQNFNLALVRDITERKQSEEALRQLNARLQTLIQAIPDQVFFKDNRGRFLIVNKAVEDFTGLSQRDLAGKTAADMLPPDLASACKTSDEEALQSRKPVRSEEPYTSAHGKGYLDTIKAPIFDDAGNVSGLVAISRDITESKKVEEVLRENEKRYHTLFEQSPDGIVIINSQGKIIEFNESAHRELGYTREEFEKFSVADLDPDEDPNDVKARLSKIMQKGKVDFQVKHRTKQGELRDVHVIVQAIMLSGSPVFHSIWHDFTRRKKAEEKIRQSEEFIRNMLDSVDEGFIVIDRDFHIVMTNKAYCGQTGRERCEIIGKCCYEISHKSLKPCYEEGEDCAVSHVFATGEPHTAVHRHTDAEGSIIYVETKAFPITDSSGAVISAIETVNNVTEKHLLEEERLKSHKLEAIGTLAGGIAHDFNNLLQGVFGYISMAKITCGQKERQIAMLEQAEKALHLSVNLTTQLLTFSKGGKPVKKKIELQPVIENSVKFALSGSNVEYHITFDNELWRVEADDGQIGQVVQNIVLNADQAMPRGGTVSITAKNVDARVKGITPPLMAGKYVEIAIADTGIGIPEQHLPRIFDPYFTTKDKGSGLGLATSYSIIKNHGGLIDVKSQSGAGTTFVIYIPAIEGKETVKKPLSSVIAASRTGKILLMDDEDLVRSVAGIMLKSLGHDVEFAENGDVAVAKYHKAMLSGSPFGVVILDLTIRGGKGGKETLRELLALDPGVTAIVSSGYSDDDAVSEYPFYGFKACLAKPYEKDTLRDTLNSLL